MRPPLTIIVAEASPARFRTALTLALTEQALGAEVRLFLQEGAVALLEGDDAAAFAAAGLPGRAAMLDQALEAGVAVIGCQSGMALVGRAAADFDGRIAWGGMVGLLASQAGDRLVVI